jgi:hypothetical protein
VPRKTIDLAQPAPAGAAIFDVYGQRVGVVVSSEVLSKDPPKWRAEVDLLTDDVDLERLQILEIARPQRSING